MWGRGRDSNSRLPAHEAGMLPLHYPATGATGGNRTHKPFQADDFESTVSTVAPLSHNIFIFKELFYYYQ